MGSIQKALLYTEEWCLSQGKAVVQLFELQAELATFCMEHHFLLTTDYLDVYIWQILSYK